MNIKRAIGEKNCTGCTACASVCPCNAITMLEKTNGFQYPEVNQYLCVHCGKCIKVCPCLSKNSIRASLPRVYAAKNLDDIVRQSSSSGGIFSIFAEEMLAGNGIIYGCELIDGKVAEHIRCEDINSLRKIRGSKYIQSSLQNSFAKVKLDLLANHNVLFVGTPCQVAGVKSFIGDNQRLLTVELLCHGVPSPGVYRKYIHEMEELFKSKVTDVFFRKKMDSWRNYVVCVEFLNGKFSYETFKDNPFMVAFLDNLCLRPSCYNCQFKNGTSGADFTLGDFWGIENICPALDDDKGTSIVLVHSQKGLEFFAKCASKMNYCETDFEKSLIGNPTYFHSVLEPKMRGYFMKNYSRISIRKLVRKYRKKSTNCAGVFSRFYMGIRTLMLKILR
jgi:coenzyme F420-reducing hydrogenase beta subunit